MEQLKLKMQEIITNKKAELDEMDPNLIDSAILEVEIEDAENVVRAISLIVSAYETTTSKSIYETLGVYLKEVKPVEVENEK